MFQPYEDITTKLGPPTWWDENGVPRYAPFNPDIVAGVYANYTALLHVGCQECRRILPVAWSWANMTMLCRVQGHPTGDEVFARSILGLPTKEDPGSVGYGDAPIHYDGVELCTGCFMSTEVVQIVQFWRRPYNWERDGALEFDYTVPDVENR